MEKNKKCLTNQKISEDFESPFKLVKHAIAVATNMIQSGRLPRVKADTQNRALLVLEEIREGKDFLDEISESNNKVDEKVANYQDVQEKRKEKRHF